TVSTGTPEITAKKLNVHTVPLYGFTPDSRPATEFEDFIRGFALYIWAGATGLSDYPQLSCELLEYAQKAGVRCVVWGVGMNDRLNPAFFRLGGKRLMIAQKLGLVDFFERRRETLMRKRIVQTLRGCDLVILRDKESLAEVQKSDSIKQASYGADSAIIQEDAPTSILPSPGLASATVGICISAQNTLKQLHEFADYIDNLIEIANCRVVFIPMNPVTDRRLLEHLRMSIRHPESTVMFEGVEPDEVQRAAGECDLIISSRLHLMILGLNHLIPAIGIARGSKIANFLNQFDLPVAGSTDECDFAILHKYTAELLKQRTEFKLRAASPRQAMLDSLAAAERRLAAFSEICHH
ncbi:MAG: polysaccharide pyruvyl transferase family protein, partial [Victivallaceae bacterium]|nr:polysaccharide pyruvyl transferase family protein [Victivallaceae bacterium]